MHTILELTRFFFKQRGYQYQWEAHFYRLPTKFREGNVFTDVCQEGWAGYLWSHVRSGGECPWSHVPSFQESGYSPPDMEYSPPPALDMGPAGVVDTHPHYWHLVAAAKTCTVAMRALRILLDCFLELLFFLSRIRRGTERVPVAIYREDRKEACEERSKAAECSRDKSEVGTTIQPLVTSSITVSFSNENCVNPVVGPRLGT